MNEARLRWALRYILTHPEMSPAILADEWQIPIDDAINICASNLSVCMFKLNLKEFQDFSNIEDLIFTKLIDS